MLLSSIFLGWIVLIITSLGIGGSTHIRLQLKLLLFLLWLILWGIFTIEGFCGSLIKSNRKNKIILENRLYCLIWNLIIVSWQESIVSMRIIESWSCGCWSSSKTVVGKGRWINYSFYAALIVLRRINTLVIQIIMNDSIVRDSKSWLLFRPVQIPILWFIIGFNRRLCLI